MDSVWGRPVALCHAGRTAQVPASLCLATSAGSPLAAPLSPSPPGSNISFDSTKNQECYGAGVTAPQILSGQMPPPAEVRAVAGGAACPARCCMLRCCCPRARAQHQRLLLLLLRRRRRLHPG